MPKKANVTLGPIYCSWDEVVVLRAGFLAVAGTLMGWATFTDQGGEGPGNLAVLELQGKDCKFPCHGQTEGAKDFRPHL